MQQPLGSKYTEIRVYRAGRALLGNLFGQLTDRQHCSRLCPVARLSAHFTEHKQTAQSTKNYTPANMRHKYQDDDDDDDDDDD